jgi:hypothetical protein
MGEFSDYFADFPEEDPANYVGGRFLTPELRAERERLRVANKRLDETLPRKEPDLGRTPPPKPRAES